MGCDTKRNEIDRWLKDMLDAQATGAPLPSIDDDILRHAAHCDACALHLETARMIAGTSHQLPAVTHHIPAGLQERLNKSIMSTIKEEKKNKDPWDVRTNMKRYLLVAAAVIMILIPSLTERDKGFVPIEEPGSELAQVRLEIEIPKADTVVVVGDWNNWNPQTHYLAKSDGGETWSIEMQLERGKEYRYQFVIDGEQWIADPNAYLQVDDGFGGTNSILEM